MTIIFRRSLIPARAAPLVAASTTTIYTQSLTMDDSGREDRSLRQLVLLTGDPGSSTQIRVTFKAANNAAWSCDNCSIGLWTGINDGETTAAPTELLFSGVSGFAMTALAGGREISSDWLTIAGSAVAGITSSSKPIVVMDNSPSNGNPMHQTGLASGENKLGLCGAGTATYNQATSAAITAASYFANRNHGVTLIEGR